MATTAAGIGELHVNVEAKALWTDQNLDVLGEHYTDDFVYHSPDGRKMDLTAYEAYTRGFHEAFPDAEVTVHQNIVDRDTTVARFTYHGTWEGTFRGMEPNGSGFSVDGMSMARMEDGKIAEVWRSIDSVGMLGQLGIIDLPA